MRPLEELIFFQTIEVLLVIVRIFAIIYFFRETLRYYRFQGEQKDPYTILTFLFLALSIILLFLHRTSEIVEKITIFLISDDIKKN